MHHMIYPSYEETGGAKERRGIRTLARSVSNHSDTEVFDLAVAAGCNGTVM